NRARDVAGPVTGGDSSANTSVDGGDGGSVNISQDPLALSGDSGASTAQSSATNTGNTGGASSTAWANPVAESGNSGTTGNTGKVNATEGALNTGIKGKASAGG